MMKKQEMIHAIQVAEARAWKAYRDATAVPGLGYSTEQIIRLRSNWCTLYDLREEMGIAALTPAQLFVLNLAPMVA